MPLRRTLELMGGTSRYYAGNSRLAIGASLVRMGRYSEGLRMLQQAGEDFANLSDDSNVNTILHLRHGEALAGLDRHAEAMGYFDQVRRELADGSNPRYQVLLHEARAASLKALGQPAAALAEYEQFMRLTRIWNAGHGIRTRLCCVTSSMPTGAISRTGGWQARRLSAKSSSRPPPRHGAGKARRC